MQSNSNLTQSQRVDGGLIVRKTTLIKMNTKPIDDVYDRSSKVSPSAALSQSYTHFSLTKDFFVPELLINGVCVDIRKGDLRRGELRKTQRNWTEEGHQDHR